MVSIKISRSFTLFRIIGLMILSIHSCQSVSVRKYYLSAEDVEWDYAPTNMNVITGKVVTAGSIEGKYLISGPHRIGKKYTKVQYFGYTDETFKTRVPTSESHGLLGPNIYGEVGDTIEILFKNMASRPYSLHTHGVLYDKISEGAKYNDGTSDADKVDDSVDPGSSHTYIWRVEDISGPTDEESNCIAWPYHSHILTNHDTSTGVVGASIICRPGILDGTGKRQDVDRDVVLLVTVIDENSSYYIDKNIKAHCTDPDNVNPEDEDFQESNMMQSINGYVFGNLPGLDMCLGDRIAWHIFSLGTETDLHTLYFHGNILNIRGNRRDAFSTSPAYFLSGEMEANNPGTWLLTSEVFTHRLAGTQALYTVRNDCANAADVAIEPIITATKQYYIKAEEVLWNYAPSGLDGFDQKPLTDPDSPGYPYFVDNQERIGGSYKKAVFVEYTDSTFTTKAVRGPEEEHLGFLGPVIHAEVGDEILVTFYNGASRNYSIQAHGVLYDKASEGSGYNDGTTGADRDDNSVPPGSQYTYRWLIPANYGPINPDEDCLTWVYYSAVDPERDVYSGLVGQIAVCRPGTKVTDYHLLLMNVDENRSWYINENILSYTNLNPDDALNNEDFLESNVMHSINGYSFANLPGLDQTCVGQEVSWHLASLGGDADEHGIYFRGHPVTFNNRRTDTVSLAPGNSVTVPMTPQRSGTWPIECMTGAHFVEGMRALYSVISSCAKEAEEDVSITDDRTYYIAAEEIYWDYASVKIDPITNQSLLDPNSPGNIFVKQEGPFIGSVYKKALYREYTDATFTQRLHEGPFTDSLGILGPIIHGEVYEQITVVFKNMASRPYSMHPHGLVYQSNTGDTKDPVVDPGMTHTYTVYAYYSDADRVIDTHSGLIGPLIICKKGILGLDGKRIDVDREFVLLFTVSDENLSWYLDDNIAMFSPDPSLVDKGDPDFEESNLMHGMNGYLFDNNKHLEMYLGETVEWNLIGFGEEVDIHTVHFHGQPVVYQQWMKHSVDVIELFPGIFSTVQVKVKEKGTWLLHCHVNDHMVGGMEGTYKVLDPFAGEAIGRTEKPWTTAGNSSAGYCIVLLLTNLFIALVNF
ncbi:hephaestin-like protein [Amphiura filiformis]|uniref:hephaestin-like protein n=1 Tax=Amphiura filiformis TaxID=82378 RepID=UPI003B220E3B